MHGAFTRALPIAAIRAELIQQKGFTEGDVPPTMRIIIDALAEADVMRQSFFHYLTRTGGPISAKGRTRRAVEGWSGACDRCAKLAANDWTATRAARCADARGLAHRGRRRSTRHSTRREESHE